MFESLWENMFADADATVFRPTSLIMTGFQPTNIFFLGQASVAVILGLGTYMDTIGRIVCLVIAAAVYLGLINLTSSDGGFIQLVHSAAFRSCCLSGCLMCVAQGILIVLGKQATLPLLITFVLAFAVLMFVLHLQRNHVRNQRLVFLDGVMEDATKMDDMKTMNQWVNVTIQGFRVGHPVCMDWSIVKWACHKWPDHATPWFMYTKFVCIFPEQSQALAWIYRTVVTNKVRSSAVSEYCAATGFRFESAIEGCASSVH
jgi:hypothetical protein